MKHSHKKEIRDQVNRLLCQYKEYNAAKTEAEKERIGDEMTYTDPIIWMMYKREAYAESDHAINTLGELREHSIDHGGICAKRFHFLSSFILEKYGKDISSSHEFSDTLEIEKFYESEIVEAVVANTDFANDWKKYEFYRIDGKVSKWQNYLVQS
jgi:hypothetical protein